MRATAPAFKPTEPITTMTIARNQDDEDDLDKSLLKALLKEKELNREAKSTIQSLKVRAEAAEALVMSLKDENRTLKAAKTLLEAIVKRRASRPNISPMSAPVSLNSSFKEQQEVATACFHTGWPLNVTHIPILYDVLAQQREIYETRSHADDRSKTLLEMGTPRWHSQRQLEELTFAPDDENVFDLSFLSQLNQGSHNFSGDESIFRHFLDEAELIKSDSQLVSSDVQNDRDTEHNLLIDISPSHPTSPIQKSPTKSAVAGAVTSCHQVVQSIMSSNSTGIMKEGVRNLERPPTLQLPASFLSKYRPTTKLPSAVESSRELSSTSAPVGIAETTTQLEVPHRDENLHRHYSTEYAAPSSEIASYPSNDGSQLNLLENSRKQTKKSMEEPVRTVNTELGVRFPIVDTKINWVIGKFNPLFDDEEAKRSSCYDNNNRRSCFWDHPVRFLPDSVENNLYRTIMVDYLPAGSTYQDVLAHLRTGALESIQIFPPLPGKIEFYTARAVFLHEEAAVKTIIHYQKRLTQGDPIKINGVPVRFWQVLIPTYPMRKDLEIDIFKHGYTRILLLGNSETSGVLPKLHEKIAPELKDGSVVKITRAVDGVPMIEFTSVAAATGAMRRMQGDREFKGCIFDFDRDYCDNPFSD